MAFAVGSRVYFERGGGRYKLEVSQHCHQLALIGACVSFEVPLQPVLSLSRLRIDVGRQGHKSVAYAPAALVCLCILPGLPQEPCSGSGIGQCPPEDVGGVSCRGTCVYSPTPSLLRAPSQHNWGSGTCFLRLRPKHGGQIRQCG